MILMHADRNVRIQLDQRLDQFGEHDVVGIGAGAAARLNNDRGIGGGGRLHDRQALLHVVDVERRDAVAMLGRMVEQLTKGNAGHGLFSVNECGWLALEHGLKKVDRPYSIPKRSNSMILSCVVIDRMIPIVRDAL